MNVNRPLAAILTAGAITAPATAVADAHHAKPMTYRYAAAVAVDYWHRHGQLPCGPIRHRVLTAGEMAVYNAIDHTDALMRAERSTCTILSTPLAEAYRRDRDMAAQNFCGPLVHEIGHLAGLEHTNNGSIMDPDTGDTTPWGCTHRRAFLRRIERAR